MLVQEILEDNPDLIKSYSDAGYFIMNTETGEKWGEAIDPVSVGRTYVETDELIPVEEEEEVHPPEEEELR